MYGEYTLPLWSLFLIFPVSEYIAYVVASKLFSHVLFLKQLGRFGIVGLMNFAVDTGIATTLRRAYDVDPASSQIIPILIVATIVAIVNSYFWQRMWTFAEKEPPSRKEFLAFVTITLLGLAINTSITFVAIKGISAFGALQQADRLVTVAKILATGVSLFWNFLGYKFFVFRA